MPPKKKRNTGRTVRNSCKKRHDDRWQNMLASAANICPSCKKEVSKSKMEKHKAQCKSWAQGLERQNQNIHRSLTVGSAPVAAGSWVAVGSGSTESSSDVRRCAGTEDGFEGVENYENYSGPEGRPKKPTGLPVGAVVRVKPQDRSKTQEDNTTISH